MGMTTPPRPRIPFLPWYNINEEVELVGFGERFGNVGARECAPLVRVGDDVCTGGYFGDEDCLESS